MLTDDWKINFENGLMWWQWSQCHVQVVHESIQSMWFIHLYIKPVFDLWMEKQFVAWLFDTEIVKVALPSTNLVQKIFF